MGRIGWVLAAAMLFAATPAAPAEAQLPAELWPRAVACASILFFVVDAAQDDVETQSDKDALGLIDASLTSWIVQMASLPEHAAGRTEQDVGLYLGSSLGSGPEALDSDTRMANLEVCVNEAVQREAAGAGQ